MPARETKFKKAATPKEAPPSSGGGSQGSVGFGNTKRTPLAQTWTFTWNNPPEDGYKLFVDQLVQEFEGAKYVFQQEVGASGTPHYQGVIRLTSRKRLIGKIQKSIHWEKCRSWFHSINYCSDVSKRAPGGVCWSNIELPAALIKITFDRLRPWQKTIAEKFNSAADEFDRAIHWFWEPEGNIGKTVLAKYFVDNKKAICVGGKGADIRFAIQQYVSVHNEGPGIVIINLPRCVDHVSWEAIENLKDGLFFSGKYEGGMVRYNTPHILVFSNTEPPYERLSVDRWVVQRVIPTSVSLLTP